MIRRLAIKTLLADRTRSISAIVAMILTALLFSTLFTTVMGMNSASRYYNIKQTGTECHFVVRPWTSDLDRTLENIRENNRVESVGVRKFLAYAVNEELNYNVEVAYEDEASANTGFHKLEQGHMPVQSNEIAMDTTTMKNLGIPKKMGAKVSLDLNAGNSTVTEEFVVCGWYEMNNALQSKIGQAIVSKDYIDIWEKEFTEDSIYGSVNIEVLLKSDKDIEAQAKEILEKAGAGAEVDHISLNPAYVSEVNSLSVSNLIFLIIVICIIILVGYLIISNIFYIAAKKDTKQYGQLKIIGMSNKQLAAFVRWQAGLLLIVAIPIGLILGLVTGEAILPKIMLHTTYSAVAGDKLLGTGAIIDVLLFSAIFVVVTTMISMIGPIRIIKKLSPVESTRPELKSYRTQRKSTNGSQLHKFAFYNIFRNRKSMVLLLISISLPLLLVIVSYNICNSFDMNKYVSSMIYSDYTVATASYYEDEYMSDEGESYPLDPQIVDQIREADFIQNESVIYGSCDVTNVKISGIDMEDSFLNLYGLDGLDLEENRLVEKDCDLASFLDGSGILEGVWLGDDGNIYQGNSQYDVGDQVVLEDAEGVEKAYTVVGHINIGLGAFCTQISGDTTYELYLCPEQYSTLTQNQDIMSYEFDVKSGDEEEDEAFMKALVEANPEINYQSKASMKEEFYSLKWTFELICFFLCGVLVFIAMVNLINVFVTSIIVREKEIATLRSIGMTRKQLTIMLMWEVSYYTGFAFVISTVISLILSATMMPSLCNSVDNFLTYTMRWEIYLFVLIGIFIVGFITVFVMEKQLNRKNIAEELKVL